MDKSFFKNFCDLCWRPLDRTKKTRFCTLHQQKHDNGRCYKKRLRELNKVSKRKGWQLTPSETLNKLSWEPISLQRLDRKIASTPIVKAGTWKEAYQEIKVKVKTLYPSAYPHIERIYAEDRATFIALVDGLLRVLLKISTEEEYAYDSFKKHLSEKGLRRFFITLLARLEVEKVVLNEIKYNRGPEIASVPMNNSVWEDLITTYDEWKYFAITPRLSPIARKHGVSRQSIHRRWKKLKENERHYRKALQKGITKTKK